MRKEVEGDPIDAIITSPPYAETTMNKKFENEEQLEKFAKEQWVFKHGRTLEATKRFIRKSWQGYPENPDNVGNLPLGDVDAIITSPPYSSGGWKADENPSNPIRREAKRKEQYPMRPPDIRYSANPQNLGNLPHGEIDAVITSPPYAESVNASNNPERRSERMRKAGLDPKTIVGGKARCGQTDWQYGESEGQIGRLEYVDAVITSPPYSESLSVKANVEGEERRIGEKMLDEKRYITPHSISRIDRKYSGNPENIGNLSHGEIDAVITSPPYAEANRGGGIAVKGYEGVHGRDESLHLRNDRPLSDNPDNISNMPFVDSVITSPPYHDNKSDWDSKSRAAQEGESVTYSDERGKERRNIGNIHYYDESEPLSSKYAKAKKGSETYLEAMLRCYQECFQVLKPGGRIIIIVKPFVRNKKAVDLPLHTWLLLEKCGFQLIDVLKFRLPTQSFWRVLQYQRNPDIERISHEYIIVAQKP